jgi:glycerol-3-phosphate dehydrogenase (NAD(P)+)
MGEKISVIGSGSWGTAIAVMLDKIGHNVKLWSYFEEESKALEKDRENKDFLPGVILKDSIECTFDLEKCIKESKILVTAAPSHGTRGMANKMKNFVTQDNVIVNISKGLEEDTLMRMSQVIKAELPQIDVVAFSGPSHAEEVGKGIPTTCVAACEKIEVAQLVQDVFMNKTLRVYTNSDIIGVELGGALKNVIALCAGILDGLGYGDNSKAALMTRGMVEISRLGVALGGKVETFTGLSGMGDLIVTCTSMHSRNRRAGILIGQGKTLDEALKEVKMVVEGVKTTKAAYELAKAKKVEMPIVNEAYNILFNDKDPKKAIYDLMMRSKKHEIETFMIT